MPSSSERGGEVERRRRRYSSDSDSEDAHARHRSDHKQRSDYKQRDRHHDHRDRPRYRDRRERSREHHRHARDDDSRDAVFRSPRRSRHDRSPSPRRRRATSRDASRSRSPARKPRAPLPSQNDSFRKDMGKPVEDQPAKQKPNFKPTGLLAREANTVVGTNTVLKYHEPPEARKPPPNQQWRMYVFKQKDLLDTIHLFQRSCWLIGRDQHVTDLLLEHPSISKQHAVIQFRHLTTTNEFGDKKNLVKPYLIGLDSANGTRMNGKRIEESRYIELVDGDVLAFGDSEREYVLMLPAADK